MIQRIYIMIEYISIQEHFKLVAEKGIMKVIYIIIGTGKKKNKPDIIKIIY